MRSVLVRCDVLRCQVEQMTFKEKLEKLAKQLIKDSGTARVMATELNSLNVSENLANDLQEYC
eukprot:13829823-Alexandrium_andersonii.AAC.1